MPLDQNEWQTGQVRESGEWRSEQERLLPQIISNNQLLFITGIALVTPMDFNGKETKLNLSEEKCDRRRRRYCRLHGTPSPNSRS